MQVYVQSRMLIPVPSDVERHSSFHRVFGESAGLCSVIENKVNRRWLKLDQGSYAYDVLVWNKLNAGALDCLTSAPVCCEGSVRDSPYERCVVAPRAFRTRP